MTRHVRVHSAWWWAASAALAGFLASPVFAQATLAQPAPATQAGALLAESCMSCHGLSGKGQGAIPQLAGNPQAATQAAMAEFASGTRPSTIMRIIAKGYTEDQAAALGAYFAQVR